MTKVPLQLVKVGRQFGELVSVLRDAEPFGGAVEAGPLANVVQPPHLSSAFYIYCYRKALTGKTHFKKISLKKMSYLMNIEEENRANALKCIDKAKVAFSLNKLDKAESMLLKAERLYPSQQAKDVLQSVRTAKNRKTKETSCYEYSTNTVEQKDEAIKCIDIAQNKFNDGDLARAEKMLLKAEGMYSTARAKDLLEMIRNARARGLPEVSAAREARVNPEPEPRRQIMLGPTPEQLEAIQQVMNATNDYEMFRLQRECSEYEITKARRRLAAMLHPDRNKAPDASEAFKLMGAAYVRIQRQISRQL